MDEFLDKNCVQNKIFHVKYIRMFMIPNGSQVTAYKESTKYIACGHNVIALHLTQKLA